MNLNKNSIEKADLAGKRVLMRVDFNVPQDKKTGAINQTVAAHWRDNYDLGHIMKRDWATLGPKLQGKMHIFVGGSDTFFLVNIVDNDFVQGDIFDVFTDIAPLIEPEVAVDEGKNAVDTGH